MNTWSLTVTYGVILVQNSHQDRITLHTESDSPYSPEVDPERFLKVSFDLPKGSGEAYFRSNFPFVPYEVIDVPAAKRTKFRQEPCDCLPCAVCKGDHTICNKCRMCTRCHDHVEGCVGCTGYLP